MTTLPVPYLYNWINCELGECVLLNNTEMRAGKVRTKDAVVLTSSPSSDKTMRSFWHDFSTWQMYGFDVFRDLNLSGKLQVQIFVHLFLVEYFVK